jgi:hypothetical protein
MAAILATNSTPQWNYSTVSKSCGINISSPVNFTYIADAILIESDHPAYIVPGFST